MLNDHINILHNCLRTVITTEFNPIYKIILMMDFTFVNNLIIKQGGT